MTVVQTAWAVVLLLRAGDREGARTLLDSIADTATELELASIGTIAAVFGPGGPAAAVPSERVRASLMTEAAS